MPETTNNAAGASFFDGRLAFILFLILILLFFGDF